MTGLSPSNEQHMCSRRLNLFQTRLLLTKHFHPHLNLSVSLLSASSLMGAHVCCVWSNVHTILCVSERWCMRMTYIQYVHKSYWYFLPFLLRSVSSLSSSYLLYLSSCLPFLHSSCWEADKYTKCFFKQWPWYEAEGLKMNQKNQVYR